MTIRTSEELKMLNHSQLINHFSRVCEKVVALRGDDEKQREMLLYKHDIFMEMRNRMKTNGGF